MLARKKRNEERAQPPAVEPFTYIHRGTTITGTLEASGRVRVHGTIVGTVKVTGVLEVAETGVIQGERVEASEVKILGRVEADVHAAGKIEIWKDGVLIGDVKASALDIEEGAAFTGRSEMSADRKSATARLPAANPDGAEPNPAAAAALLDDAPTGPAEALNTPPGDAKSAGRNT